MPKCAGTSITEGLKESELQRVGVHEKLTRLTKLSRKRAGANADYFTFTCVRNVYAQLVSMIFSRLGVWDRRFFISMVKRTAVMSVTGGSSWSMARIDKYIDEPIDFVMRFENLEQDWKTLLHKLQLPYRELPHEKSNPGKGHYSQYYDEKLITLVKETFADEIEKYGWEFEQK